MLFKSEKEWKTQICQAFRSFLLCTLRKMGKLQYSVLCCGSGSGLDPDSMGWFIKFKIRIRIVIFEGLIPLSEGLEAFFGA